MKAKPPEYREAPEAWTRFKGIMQRLVTIPREEMQRREAEYRKTVDANPNRRGPKRKPKPSA